jgi:predicted CXXCH cytochrome family protein
VRFLGPTKLLAILLGIALIAGLGYFLLRPAPARFKPLTRSDYADPSTCVGCHSEFAKTYRLTGMGRSFYPPRADDPVEDYQTRNRLFHQASDRYYTMLKRDGKIFQQRHQLGFDGKPTNMVEYQVDFVVGSGNHARTYLHRRRDGKLVELPVSWYAEKGGYWAMSPGYDRPDQSDFRRPISDDCMFCHNGYPGSSKRFSSAEGDAPAYSEALPEGIDCQRCHGPGQKHVEIAGSRGASKEAISGSILNPARLSRDRQLEVCMQCHLETTSRQLPGMIRRFDREPFSYRPGEPLADYALYFDHAPGPIRDSKFEVAHAAYRMRKSACFRSSQMTCTTCHDPHRALRGEEARQHYDSICRTCHTATHGSGNNRGPNCVECHMPKRRTDDAVHVVMTDHYIQRSAPAGDPLKRIQEDAASEHTYRGAVDPYYPDPFAGAPDTELYLALAQVQNGSDLEAGIPRLRQMLEKGSSSKPEFYFELGKAEAKAGQKQDAIRWLEEALRRKPNFRPALKELASALVESGDLVRAAESLEKAGTSPADSAALADLGNVYLRLGKLDRAESALEAALGANPDEPDASNTLGLVRLEKQDRAGAEKAFRDAIRSQPDFAAAHNNLASLLVGAGDYAQGKYHYEKAIASNPANADAHHGYGLLLLLTKSYERALVELQKTVLLAPDRAQAHSDLADLLAAKGNAREAVDHYRLAVHLRPDLFDAQLALAKILAQQGNAAEAREHFQKAAESTDPAIRREALERLR